MTLLYAFAAIGVATTFIGWSAFMFWLGWRSCSWDVEMRLTGKRPVDHYWRARGMRDWTRPTP